MKEVVRDQYRGWNIAVKAEKNMCANFSFEITNPAGRKQNVPLGGDNEQRALERAREMIDMEMEFTQEN